MPCCLAVLRTLMIYYSFCHFRTDDHAASHFKSHLEMHTHRFYRNHQRYFLYRQPADGFPNHISAAPGIYRLRRPLWIRPDRFHGQGKQFFHGSLFPDKAVPDSLCLSSCALSGSIKPVPFFLRMMQSGRSLQNPCAAFCRAIFLSLEASVPPAPYPVLPDHPANLPLPATAPRGWH